MVYIFYIFYNFIRISSTNNLNNTMNKKLLNTQIEALTIEHGAKIVEFYIDMLRSTRNKLIITNGKTPLILSN